MKIFGRELMSNMFVWHQTFCSMLCLFFLSSEQLQALILSHCLVSDGSYICCKCKGVIKSVWLPKYSLKKHFTDCITDHCFVVVLSVALFQIVSVALIVVAFTEFSYEIYPCVSGSADLQHHIHMPIFVSLIMLFLSNVYEIC